MEIRCCCLLIWMGFFGKAGRSFLKALVFTFIISGSKFYDCHIILEKCFKIFLGPLNNLALNAKEVVRVFTCSTTLTYNLSKTRFDLMAEPFHHALMALQNNISHIKDKFAEIENVIEPIKEEIEEPDIDYDNSSTLLNVREKRNGNSVDSADPVEQAQFYTNFYKSKIRTRCKEQIEKGAEKCLKAFSDTYDDCIDKLPIIINAMLCWPMKITFVCNIGEAFGIGSDNDGKDICDPSNEIDDRFGQQYLELRNMENLLIGNFSNVELNYTILRASQSPGLRY